MCLCVSLSRCPKSKNGEDPCRSSPVRTLDAVVAQLTVERTLSTASKRHVGDRESGYLGAVNVSQVSISRPKKSQEPNAPF